MGSLTQAQGKKQQGLSAEKQRRMRVAQIRRQGVYGEYPRWMDRALDSSVSSGIARNVLGALLRMGGGARLVEASATDIARISNTSQDWARKCLRELERLGEISVYKRGGGGRVPNTYAIHLPLPKKGGDAA